MQHEASVFQARIVLRTIVFSSESSGSVHDEIIKPLRWLGGVKKRNTVQIIRVYSRIETIA